MPRSQDPLSSVTEPQNQGLFSSAGPQKSPWPQTACLYEEPECGSRGGASCCDRHPLSQWQCRDPRFSHLWVHHLLRVASRAAEEEGRERRPCMRGSCQPGLEVEHITATLPPQSLVTLTSERLGNAVQMLTQRKRTCDCQQLTHPPHQASGVTFSSPSPHPQAAG